jgi:hypothetical protein
MKKLAIVAAVVAALALPASALALVIPGTQDQHQDNGPDGQQWGENYLLAQTFTAGMSGTLEAVTLTVGDTVVIGKSDLFQLAAYGDLGVGVYATSLGNPTGVALASASFTGVTSGTTLIAEFGSPPALASGTQYAIVLQAGTAGLANWLGVCNGDPYAGGQALIFDINNIPSWLTLPEWANQADSSACINDFEFSTYMAANATPPPTSTAASQPATQNGAPLMLLAVLFGGLAAFVTILKVRPFRR